MPYLKVPCDVSHVALAIGTRPNQSSQNVISIQDHINSVLDYTYGPVPRDSPPWNDNGFHKTLPNLSRLLILSPDEWNNREHREDRQSAGEIIPDQILDDPEDIQRMLESSYDWEKVDFGSITLFPRAWPGKLRLNSEKPIEITDYSLENSEESGEDFSREVWVSEYSVSDELERRKNSRKYLEDKIRTRKEKKAILDNFLKKRESNDVMYAPPVERSLTIPPWNVPVWLLISRKT